MKQFFRRILNLPQYLKDPEKSKTKKFLIIFGIIYLLSPVDLVPEPVFGIGIIDDIVLWIFILSYLAKELDDYTDRGRLSKEARRKYRGTKIYEAEARVIDDEGEENKGEKSD